MIFVIPACYTIIIATLECCTYVIATPGIIFLALLQAYLLSYNNTQITQRCYSMKEIALRQVVTQTKIWREDFRDLR